MPKEYCDILLFAIGTTAGLVLGFLFVLFILKDVPGRFLPIYQKIKKLKKEDAGKFSQ